MNEENNENEKNLIEILCSNYSEATKENESLMKFLSLIFLKFRNYDLNSASERLGNYLNWRRQTFNNLNEQTIENNLHLKKQIKSLFLTILPEYLPTGEAIVYLELKRHNTEVFTAEDTIKTWHYHIMCALKKDPDLARRGFYMTGNMTSISYSNLDIRVPHAIAHALSDCMPVRVCQFFVINPPYIAQLIIPVVRMLLSTKLSQRLNIITDISSLHNDFHVPLTCLPEILGGTITPDMHIEVIEQMIAQNISV